MTRSFCYMCGHKIDLKEPHVYWCDHCQQNYYDNPRPCTDLYLFDDQDRLIVGRRKYNPNKDKLDIPGGFLDFGETYEQGAIREIEEELGLTVADYSEPTYFASYYSDYPWGNENYQTAVTAFVARLTPGAAPQARDDVAEIMFMKPDELDRDEFGFPVHTDQAMTALEKLKSKNV